MQTVRARTVTLTVANGGTETEPLKFWDSMALSILTPGTLTSTILTFKGCPTNDGTFQTIKDSAGNTPTITIATDTNYSVTGSEADAIAPYAYIVLVVDQAEDAAREFVVTKK